MSPNRGLWLTPPADPGRAIPRSASERQWQIEAALAALKDEARRLDRLGFELPLARCHEQRRFWEFVRAIDVMSAAGATGASGSGDFGRAA